jgi:hypothetical protein
MTRARASATGLRLLATGIAASLLLACAAPSSAPPTPAASPEVACNRARVSAYDAWRSVESDLQRRLEAAQQIVEDTDHRKLPPAWMIPNGTFAKRKTALADVKELEAQLGPVRTASESALLGAVFARDAAKAAGDVTSANEARQLSEAAWAACKDVSPGLPSPPTQAVSR